VWHVSIGSFTLDFDGLEREARRHLNGVGDAAAGEWIEQYAGEDGKRTVHVKRRLSAAEERITGPPRDIRGTSEQARRVQQIAVLSGIAPGLLTE